MINIVNNIFSVTANSFNDYALQIFKYQYLNNAVYKQWTDALGVRCDEVRSVTGIPFLPISLYKSHCVTTTLFEPDTVFTSSGTTGDSTSRHFVKDINIYRKSFTEGFRTFYGEINDYCIIGLLPSYLERKGSSLVMMVDELIKLSNNSLSGFYLYEFEKLAAVLKQLEHTRTKTLLIGVTFALLDFAEQFPLKLNNTIIMETGGMKGRKKEMIREEVHNYMKERLGVATIHSEYGMTELLSQAYSKGDGQFEPVPWMKVLVRDDEDPLIVNESGRGLINVIDLANIDSCSFIATDDVGILQEDGAFEVVGRMDNSDIRGCSLMFV